MTRRGSSSARRWPASPADEIIDPTPVIERDRRPLHRRSDSSANLPRKFKSAITGHPSLDVVHEINDISLVGVVHPDLGPGYDLWVGGGLSVAPRLAERLGAFVRADQAAEVWHGVIRHLPRLRLPPAAHQGPAEVPARRLGAGEVPPGAADRVPRLRTARRTGARDRRTAPATTSASTTRRTDAPTSASRPPSAGSPATILAALADAAEAAGSHRIRLTPHQKLLVLDVDPDTVDDPAGGRRAARADRHTRARSGAPPWPAPASSTASSPSSRPRNTAPPPSPSWSSGSPTWRWTVPISLHVNGCPNSCARIQVADIGLKGQLMKSADGADEFAFQVHLGGGLASADRRGRRPRPHRPRAQGDRRRPPDYVERVSAGRSSPTGSRRGDVRRMGPPGRRGGAAMTLATHGPGSHPQRSGAAGARRTRRPTNWPTPAADEVAAWAAGHLRRALAVACSMAGDTVLPHLVAPAAPGVDVLFLETGYHFAETLGTRDALATRHRRQHHRRAAPADRRRAGRGVRPASCTIATPRCAASCARSIRSTPNWPATRRG